MNTLSKILIGIIVILAISSAGVILLKDTQYKDLQLEKAHSDSLYQACLLAPSDTLRIYDTVLKVNTAYYKPAVKPMPAQYRDTSRVNVPCPDQFYSDKYDTPDFTLQYEALGKLTWIKFPAYKLKGPRETIIYKTVAVDTCYGKSIIVPRDKSHLAVYVNGVFWSEFRGAGIGLDWTYRNKWGVFGGVDARIDNSQGYRIITPEARMGIRFILN